MNNAKKRLILAITQAELGGAQTFLLHFATSLKQEGHEVLLVAGDQGWLLEQAKRRGIETRVITAIHREINPFFDIKATIELFRLFHAWKPDAIHLNSSKIGVLGALAGRLAHVPRIVYRIGGWVFLEPISAWKQTFYRLMEQWTASWKDIIVCVHPGDQRVAEQYHIHPQKEVVVAPNGLDFPLFDHALLSREEARKALGIPSHVFAFGTIANFYATKDLPGYVEACALVAKHDPEAQFVIIGDGAERPRIEAKRTALRLDRQLMLAGRLPGPQLLRAFDAFVLPSAKEGMAWVLLEAMAAGLPCIATDVGANAWCLHDTGWIVPPMQPRALAQAMQYVAHHPEEAAKKGAQASQYVRATFPLERTLTINKKALLG
ncbi:MAG: glycosyltransferase family 4 protein [Patescibacteria group bacterium]